MERKFSEFNKFRESDKSPKHEFGGNLKIPSVTAVTGLVVSSSSLMQKVAGLNNLFYKKIVTEFSKFSEHI